MDMKDKTLTWGKVRRNSS